MATNENNLETTESVTATEAKAVAETNLANSAE